MGLDTNSIGFVGLGNMGFHMVRRLLEHGHSVVAYDIRPEALKAVQALGAVGAVSPADVADRVPTVMVSLPTPGVVRQVALADDGLGRGSAIRQYVDLSTTGPTVAQEVGQALEARGISALDAPVSGGVAGAAQGTLTIMAAGSRELFESMEPVLKVIARNAFYVGTAMGQGQVLKLANNLLSAAALVLTSEAMVMGTKAGLDPKTMLDVLNVSTGRNSATLDKFPRAVLPGTFDAGFKMSLMYKDVRLCLEEAESLGVPMWVGGAVKQFWTYVMTQGGGDRDFTAIVQYLEDWTGVQVRSREIPTV